MFAAWLEFLFCSLIVGVAGYRLSRYGDIIAEKMNLSGAWIGLVLIATVTSLPELVTGISSVTLADSPDIAVGSALGSCVFNLLILVMIDFLHRRQPVYMAAGAGHVLSGGFGLILIGFVGFNILLSGYDPPHRTLLTLSTPILILLYALAMRTVYRYEARNRATLADVDNNPDMTLRRAFAMYGLAGSFVAGAGLWLPFVAKRLATVMGWEETLVGSLFVAMTTSLPEMAVTFAAVRLGALDLAIGNLLGSNLFNMVIVAIDDLFYTKGPILLDVSPLHAVTAFSAIMMTGVTIVGLLYRPRGRFFGAVGWISLIIFSIYLLYLFVFSLASR